MHLILTFYIQKITNNLRLTTKYFSFVILIRANRWEASDLEVKGKTRRRLIYIVLCTGLSNIMHQLFKTNTNNQYMQRLFKFISFLQKIQYQSCHMLKQELKRGKNKQHIWSFCKLFFLSYVFSKNRVISLILCFKKTLFNLSFSLSFA